MYNLLSCYEAERGGISSNDCLIRSVRKSLEKREVTFRVMENKMRILRRSNVFVAAHESRKRFNFRHFL